MNIHKYQWTIPGTFLESATYANRCMPQLHCLVELSPQACHCAALLQALERTRSTWPSCLRSGKRCRFYFQRLWNRGMAFIEWYFLFVGMLRRNILQANANDEESGTSSLRLPIGPMQIHWFTVAVKCRCANPVDSPKPEHTGTPKVQVQNRQISTVIK